jgi:plastocyanin
MRRIAVVFVLAAGLVAARSGKVQATTRTTVGTTVGTTITINMSGSTNGYKFDPANVTIKSGDAIKFVVVSGGPHNVGFDESAIPSGAAAVLQKNMTGQQAPLIGPLMPNNGDSYTVSFAGAPPGQYHYFCLPHQSLGMVGIITVQ